MAKIMVVRCLTYVGEEAEVRKQLSRSLGAGRHNQNPHVTIVVADVATEELLPPIEAEIAQIPTGRPGAYDEPR